MVFPSSAIRGFIRSPLEKQWFMSQKNGLRFGGCRVGKVQQNKNTAQVGLKNRVSGFLLVRKYGLDRAHLFADDNA